MIKFNESIDKYQYVLSFDLAKISTGYSLIDIKNNDVILHGVLVCKESQNSFWDSYYNNIVSVLKDVKRVCEDRRVFITKEKMPEQNGKFTTIASLQALSKAHAIQELACEQFGYPVYDYDGVPAVSEKAYFRSITGIEKPTKEDIAAKIFEIYPNFDLGNETLDVTDSIAVTLTLIHYKWNNDIRDKIRETKRAIKQYKTDKKKQELLQYIDFLNTLKIQEK